MSNHTIEPWNYEYEAGFCGELIGANGTSICSFVDEPSEDNHRRIVACVNACAGIDTDIHEALGTGWLKIGIANSAKAIKQRDELLVALKRAERKLAAYVGVCDGDKELTDAVLPMVRAAICGIARPVTEEGGAA